ncbi:hypothetical protein [Streptomyces sp. SGAir0957]
MHDPIAALGINPASLAAAPSGRPPSSLVRARLAPPHPVPCTVCGAMAVASRIVEVDDQPHWLDLCRDDLLRATGKKINP